MAGLPGAAPGPGAAAASPSPGGGGGAGSRDGLRILFLGTPEFAVPSLERLADSRHRVVGAVSQPDRPQGRGRRLQPTPVRAAAESRDIAVLQPEKVGAETALAWMREREPELGVVVAFGQFIPRSVRELPRLGMINAHASLLPRHRGAAPIAYAILCGDAETGISVMRVAREMDAGEVCGVVRTPIDPAETTGELTARLAPLAAQALVDAVDRIADGTAEFVAQDASRVSLAPKLEKSLGALDWRAPRTELLRRLRAATPWPGCDVQLARSGRRLRLLRAREGPAFSGPPPAPGRLRAEGARLEIAALDGWVDVVSLQEPGGRPVEAAAFLRGARLPPGDGEEVVLV